MHNAYLNVCICCMNKCYCPWYRCGTCRAVVADLETKILRFALPDSSPAAAAAAASSLASEEVWILSTSRAILRDIDTHIKLP
jgi:hypothetical protein